MILIGYMRITDLGIARVWNPDNAKDTSGTPGYMGKDLKLYIIIYSPRSYVQIKSRSGSRLFRSWCYRI
jgi:hypothetical protein